METYTISLYYRATKLCSSPGDDADWACSSTPSFRLYRRISCSHWAKRELGGLCFCYQKDLSIPIESMPQPSRPRTLFFLFLFANYVPLLGISSFLSYPQAFRFVSNNLRLSILLHNTVSFDPKPNSSTHIQPLSVYPKSYLTHHVGGGGDRGCSVCGSQ